MKDFLKLLTNHVLVNTIVSFRNYDVIVKSNQFFPEKKVLMFSTTILADKTVGFSTSFTLDCEKDIISFFFNSHSDFFEEIAKYRAARRIWAKKLKNKYVKVIG